MAGKPPKKITQPRLRNIAVAYVERYGGSRKRLQQVLTRRAERSLRFHDEQDRRAEVLGWIDELVAQLTALGVCDEQRQARAQAVQQSLLGRPRRVIRQRLRLKGFEANAIDMAMAALEPDELDGTREPVDPDWVACCRYARRRGLGPFRRIGARERGRDKEVASMMRAGFAYRYAAQVLDAEDAETLMQVIDTAALPRF